METRVTDIISKETALKRYMTTIHLFTMFMGLFITSIGAYYINSSYSLTSSLALLSLGIIITCISFIGSFGTQLEHTGFLNTYNSISAILFLFEMVLMSLGYCYKSQMNDYSSNLWDFFLKNDPQFILDLETVSHCCGYNSILDRAVPTHCTISTLSCKSKILQHHDWIIIFLVIVLVLQISILGLSVIMSYMINQQIREEERYVSLIQHPWSNESTSTGYFGRPRKTSRYGSTYFI